MTYGDKAANAKVLDYSFVNPQLNSWIDQWNRIIIHCGGFLHQSGEAAVAVMPEHTPLQQDDGLAVR